MVSTIRPLFGSPTSPWTRDPAADRTSDPIDAEAAINKTQPNGPTRDTLLTSSNPRRRPVIDGPDPALEAALQKAAAKWGLSGAGVVMRDVDTGRSAELNANTLFSSASVIKLPLMIEVERQMAAGKLSGDKVVTIVRANYTDTWCPPGETRPLLHPGDKRTVKQLLELMISRSDNVATNTLLDQVGRQNLNATMQSLGALSTTFHHKLSGGSIAVNDPGYDGGRNQTSSHDMALLLGKIEAGTLISPSVSAEMKRILGMQMDNDKIPKGLPVGAKVFHKTGETSHVTHDVAIVETGGKRYILTMLTNNPPGGDTYKRMVGLTNDLNGALAGQIRQA
jgi:beta-lactamase class A